MRSWSGGSIGSRDRPNTSCSPSRSSTRWESTSSRWNESIDTSTPMGKMIFTVIGAVAELERSLIRERVMMGLDRARRQGKKLGRPQKLVDREQVATLRAKGLTLRQIAAELSISKDKVARI